MQLSAFLNQKLKNGRLHGGGLSAKSVRDIGVLIKAALRAAVAEYHFPCDALNAKLPKAKQRKIEPFSSWELDRLGKALSPSANHKDVGILLSVNGGLRLGEVCALRVSDIDFQNGTVNIVREVLRIKIGTKTQLVVQTPKSESSVRTIPLPTDALAFLKKAVAGLPKDAYVLTGRTDKPMEPRTYQYYFESVLRRCGIRKRCYHTLRHTYATRCIEKGIDIKSVSEMLGHADVVTTKFILLRVRQRHALKPVRLFFQMHTEHTEHTAGALCAGRCQLAVLLDDLTVNRRIRDARHFEVRQNILLCPERHRL